MHFDGILRSALELRLDEQERLVDLLLDSLNERYIVLTEEDEAAIERGLEQIERGEIIPLNKFLERLRKPDEL